MHGIRYELTFGPRKKTIYVPLKGLQYRIYSRILKCIESADSKYASILHMLQQKPFTFSSILCLDSKRRFPKIVEIDGEKYLKIEGRFRIYFASMVDKVYASFMKGAVNNPPPFDAELLTVKPLEIVKSEHFKARIKLNTLSPIYVRGHDPSEDEFREKIIDALEVRIKTFWGVDPPNERPLMYPHIDYNRGYKPEKTVVFIIYNKDKKVSVDARKMRFRYYGPPQYLMAGFLGGFGYKTHLGLGYVRIDKESKVRNARFGNSRDENK